jgi:16S rRNA C1402 (ribose-2'-O) methylase RsmI
MAAFKTNHFSVSVLLVDGTEKPTNQPIIDRFRTLLAENDNTPPTVLLDALSTPDKRGVSDVDLWLIPGHIGNPLDLSIHSLRILQSIDVLLVEADSTDVVEQIFEQFALGDLPRVVEIEENRSWLKTLLEDARNSGHCLGLFGANEGSPGLCDPGWRVLEVANSITPGLVVRSVSAGSALTTALMYSDSALHRFQFVGLFENTDGSSPMLGAICRLMPWEEPQAFIGFAEGTSLRKRWPDLHRVTRTLHGSLTLMANMSRPAEYVQRICLSDMTQYAPDILAPEDKVVVRVNCNRNLNPFRWLQRILMRPFAPWR